MKKITKIEYQKNSKDRVNIYLDDIFAFGIDINIMIKHCLAKNMELDDEFIEEILKAEEEICVYNYALSVLSRYAKSEKQLRLKLKEKGYDINLIDNAILKLKQQKYIDDERYSDALINSKINISKFGKRRIKEALYEKGIDREIIDEKINQLSDDEELKRACTLLTKKVKSIKEDDTRKLTIKLSNVLINKGFEYSTVKKAVKQVLDLSLDEFDSLEE
ncbi:MAG: regulatory protein RecX [Sedimentibacter sp.]